MSTLTSVPKLASGYLLALFSITALQASSAPTLTFKSATHDNIFLADSGALQLQINGANEGDTGQLRLSDEYGTTIQRISLSADTPLVKIPLPHKGYYHATAELTTIDRSIVKASTSAAVIGPALSDEMRMQSFLGLWNVHGPKEGIAAAGARFNRRMTALFKYDRDFLRYADPTVEPEPKAKQTKDEPAFSDIGVISFGLPEWLLDPAHASKHKHSYGSETRTPTDWDELKTLVKAFTNNPPWPEFPQYFEIYNEPEWQWEGSDEDFARFLATIADGIKEARPDVQVLGPGFSQPRLQSSNRIGMFELEKLGLFEHLDGIVVHCYVDGSAPEGEFIQNIIDLKQFLEETGHGDMPIHFTEFGWTSYPGTWQRPVDELTQAQYLVRSLALLATQDAASAVYFCYIFSGNGKLGEQGFSIAHMDGTPKPSYAAYSNLARFIAGTEGPYHWLQLGPSVNMVLFGRDRGSRAILWDAEGTRTFALPGNPDQMADMVGRRIEIPADRRIDLSPSPLFVTWADIDGSRLTEEPAQTLMRGNSIDFRKGNIRWILPKPLKLESQQLSAPGDTPVGTYRLLALDKAGWHTQLIEVIAPLEVSPPTIIWPADAESPVLSVIASSYTQTPLKVRAAASVNELRSFFAESQLAPPEASIQLDVPLTGLNLGQRYQGHYEIVSQSPDQRDRIVEPFEFTLLTSTAIQNSTPNWEQIPAIDFSEWAPFGGPILPEDCSATLQSAYSDKGLHLRIQVRDDHHIQNASAENMWSQDAIQIGIDMDIDKPWSANEFYGLKGHRVFEYGVGGNPDKPMTWRWISYLPELPAGESEPRIDFKLDRSGEITTYDVLFPWPTLGADAGPAAGSSIGIALSVSDSDPSREKERRALRLFNGIIDSKAPERFGRLWLR